MKFGIYFIPDESNFYKIGSQLIGYDIRNKKILKPFFSGISIENDYIKNATAYGFHMTITDSVSINSKQIPEIEQKIKKIISLLNEKNHYYFKFKSISFRGSANNQIGMKYTPSSSMLILHTLLVTNVQSLGNSCLYHENLINGIDHYSSMDFVRKIEQYQSPYVLDRYRPHFTLFNPLKLDFAGRKKILLEAKQNFVPIKHIDVNKISMVLQDGEDQLYTIHNEFTLK